MKTDGYILLWIKNQKYTLLHELAGIKFSEQPDGILELNDIQAGSWSAEWINTIDATTLRKELVESKGGKLILNTPSINESVAVKLIRLR